MVRAALGCIVLFSAGVAHATLPPTYTLDRGEIVADAGEDKARVIVDCASPSALVVRGSDVLVACGDELLTYTTSADVLRPALVDRQRTPCADLDEHGACRASAEVEIVEPLVPALATSRERRTTLGAIIIGVSLASAAVLEGGAWMARLAAFSGSGSGDSNAPYVFDVASVIVAVGGTIAGIAVAATWQNVTKTTMLLPSVEVLHGGGMIGLRVVF